MAATIEPITLIEPTAKNIPHSEPVVQNIKLKQGDSLNELNLQSIIFTGIDWMGDGVTSGLNPDLCLAAYRNGSTIYPIRLKLKPFRYTIDEKYRSFLEIIIWLTSEDTATAPIGTYDYDVQLGWYDEDDDGEPIIRTPCIGKITFTRQVSRQV